MLLLNYILLYKILDFYFYAVIAVKPQPTLFQRDKKIWEFFFLPFIVRCYQRRPRVCCMYAALILMWWWWWWRGWWCGGKGWCQDSEAFYFTGLHGVVHVTTADDVIMTTKGWWCFIIEWWWLLMLLSISFQEVLCCVSGDRRCSVVRLEWW